MPPQPPPGLKAVSHAQLLRLLAQAVKHVRVHVDRRLESSGDDWRRWAVLKGLLENGIEVQRATGVVLAENQRWPQMPVAAALLARSLVETLGHVMLLGETPAVVFDFERHHYRETFEKLREDERLFGSNPAYKAMLKQSRDSLAWLAEKMRLSAEQAKNPPRGWQWPGVAVYSDKVRGKGPLLSGTRRQAFRIAYVGLYRQLSWFVHQSLGAVVLHLTEERHGPSPLAASNLTAKATTLLAALLTEATYMARVKPPPTLSPLWDLLLEVLEWSRGIHRVRYRKLLEDCVLQDLRGA